MRPSGGLAPIDETDEQRMARFLENRKRFIDAHLELVAALDHNSAFIDENVFEAVDALRNRTTREKMALQVETPFETEWYDRGDAAIADVMQLTNAVSATIRSRLASLVVSDGDPR